MKREETLLLLKKSLVYYPLMKMESVNETFEFWHDILKDYEFDRVLGNFENHLKTSQFAPTIADLIKPAPKRPVPNVQETRQMLLEREEQSRLVLNDPGTAIAREEALAEMRKTLGIERG